MKKKVVRPGHIKRDSGIKKIHVSRLQLGMYVSKLDRDWLDTPFLMQGFLVESLDDIDILAELCEFVWIDAVFEKWVNPEERAVSDDAPKYRVCYINKLPPQEEHKKALGIYREARKITKSLLDEVRLGNTLNTEQAKSTVSDCVMSVMRNPDALMWMSKIRDGDSHTADHCLNVCILAIAFGRHMGLTEEELHKLGLCGLLHDIGKVRIDPILLRKGGELSAKEKKVLEAHPVYGRNLLLAAKGIYHGAVDVVYSHHEHVDGSGYPRKLKSAGISQFAKMIALVDAYDKMTVPRYIDNSITCTEALKDIYKKRGTQFDPQLALIFIKAVGLYPAGSIVELVNHQVAVVLETNHRHHHLPKIILLLNKDKEAQREKVVNLEHINQHQLGKDYLIKKVHKDGSFGICIKDLKDKGLQFGSNI